MKGKEIEKELCALEKNLCLVLTKEKGKNISSMCGYSQSDICDYLAGRKKWSWRKILDVAGSVGL